jgi:hypothetical protein
MDNIFERSRKDANLEIDWICSGDIRKPEAVEEQEKDKAVDVQK